VTAFLRNSLAEGAQNVVAVRFTASRKAPTADELQRLATEADFSAVEVSIRRINIHLPRVDKFVLDHLAATPVAEAIDAAGAETRKKIGASAMDQLQRYANGDGITYPEETYVLTARAG
jgi:hypothetical protein